MHIQEAADVHHPDHHFLPTDVVNNTQAALGLHQYLMIGDRTRSKSYVCCAITRSPIAFIVLAVLIDAASVGLICACMCMAMVTFQTTA